LNGVSGTYVESDNGDSYFVPDEQPGTQPVYVDENGNVIENITGDAVYVDENGNVIENIGADAVYVDENGNVIENIGDGMTCSFRRVIK
jgi:hypothetical protein